MVYPFEKSFNPFHENVLLCHQVHFVIKHFFQLKLLDHGLEKKHLPKVKINFSLYLLRINIVILKLSLLKFQINHLKNYFLKILHIS